MRLLLCLLVLSAVNSASTSNEYPDTQGLQNTENTNQGDVNQAQDTDNTYDGYSSNQLEDSEYTPDQYSSSASQIRATPSESNSSGSSQRTDETDTSSLEASTTEQTSSFFATVKLNINAMAANVAVSKFFESVKTALKTKVAENKIAEVLLVQESLRKANSKLLEEPDYEYVNVYNCKDLSVPSPEDIGKQPYGCLYEASISYVVSMGKIADKNITGTINDIKNYQDAYDAYLRMYQLQIFSIWAVWYKENFGNRYYSCPTKNGIENYAKCERPQPKGMRFQTGVTIFVENSFIPDDKKDDAVIAMTNYWNTLFQSSDLDQVSRDKMELSKSSSAFTREVTIKNVTGPKVMNMIPNPMLNISNQNVTDMRKLISFLETNLYKESAHDLFDMLSPAQVYISLSDSISQIRIDGKRELEFEAKQRKMMILNIVLLIVGVFSMVLGPEMMIALDSAVAIASIAGSFAITGKMSAGDMILSLVGAFAGGLRGVALGLKLGEVANTFRFTRSIGKFSQLMKAIHSYLQPMEAMFGMSYSGSTK